MRVKNAQYLSDYKVKIQFMDETIIEADFKDFIFSSLQPMTNQFKDKKLFAKVGIWHGALDWFRQMDFDPNDLYKNDIPGVIIHQLQTT